MSIRTALLVLLLSLGALTTGLVGVFGVLGITQNVRREAQERVNKDLGTFRAYHEERQRLLAQRIETVATGIQLDDPNLQATLQHFRDRLDLHVLNVCRVSGEPVAGNYPDDAPPVPVDTDPVLRRALTGRLAFGTVLLNEDRLGAIGGPALQAAVRVTTDPPNGNPPITDALFWWVACPLVDSTGRVEAILYGGRALNLNFQLVDELRELVFGTGQYQGKPRGTVTIFLRGARVATNVLGPNRRRAVNTLVSNEVQRQVLEAGVPWSGRAWVVDAWYLSAYEPLLDPDGNRIGMLYVGLLEAPYEHDRAQAIGSLLSRIGIIGLVAIAVTILIVNRITKPLKELNEAASHVALGDREMRVSIASPYREIRRLALSFRDMQDAIAERDRHLNEQNDELADANTKLARANRNYMESLGFVTHELKSPLAAMQGMIDVIHQGYVGELPERASDFLLRIKRNCEDLQDMVKNYLDLSRAERGELAPEIAPVNLYDVVVEPCAVDVQPLFESRDMVLEVNCPRDLVVSLDQELIRIALSNFLSNAAKYGQEKTTAWLQVHTDDQNVTVAVWNEGAGFTPEEGAALFAKFTRLKNRTTRGKRGSGLGLFLCKQIVELHGGAVWAESEPGKWARFSFRIPLHAAAPQPDPASQSAAT